MCGIVGLHLRTPELYPRLGELLTGMLCEMGDRGSDSAGVAVYGDPIWSPPGRGCVSVLEVDPTADDLGLDVSVTRHGDTYLLTAEVSSEMLLDAVKAAYPQALIAGFGSDMAVLKGVGHPRTLTDAWGLAKAQGWQGVGHTRMATESAVTPAGCHPYAVGPEQCMVHNGSFANHATIRRELRAAGVQFDSENDTEVGARFIAEAVGRWSRRGSRAQGTVCDASTGSTRCWCPTATRSRWCATRSRANPAVIAETDDWVAMGSEYRALAGLPGASRPPRSGSRSRR